jgi:hypothetical protein
VNNNNATNNNLYCIPITAGEKGKTGEDTGSSVAEIVVPTEMEKTTDADEDGEFV